jgi:hypothetical protein
MTSDSGGEHPATTPQGLPDAPVTGKNLTPQSKVINDAYADFLQSHFCFLFHFFFFCVRGHAAGNSTTNDTHAYFFPNKQKK